MKSGLFEGEVAHARFEPIAHAFRFPLLLLWLDLGEADRVFAGRWLWGVERRTLVSFRRADHLGDPSRPLDAEVRRLVASRLGRAPSGPIRLLAAPRWLGFAFNPVSLYFCYRDDGESLDCVVAEVTNTPWSERHCYVLPGGGARAGEEIRFEHAKEFHVSPFLPMDLVYDWRIRVPDESLELGIACRRAGRRVFAADLALERREIGGRELVRGLVRHPAMTARVIAGIYWQALRLRWRGAPFHSHPGALENAA
jgi:DUF1365 family protein